MNNNNQKMSAADITVSPSQFKSVASSITFFPLLCVVQTLITDALYDKYPDDATLRIQVIWAAAGLALALVLVWLAIAALINEKLQCGNANRRRVYLLPVIFLACVAQTAIQEIFVYYYTTDRSTRVIAEGITAASLVPLSYILCVFVCNMCDKRLTQCGEYIYSPLETRDLVCAECAARQQVQLA